MAIPSNFRLFTNLVSPFSPPSSVPLFLLLIFTVGQFVQRKENLNVCLNRIPLSRRSAAVPPFLGPCDASSVYGL